ncbi:MAG: phage baseplate assembly protein V [Vicinamibacterales bacterium]
MAPISGVAVGIVSDANDPAGRGRVRVRVPAVNEASEAWAPTLTAPGASGPETGYREGDEVLVAFEHGDARKPYVLGLLWSGKDTPPAQR